MGTTLRKIWTWRKLLTIEPLLFFYYMPSLLLYAATENFPMEKSCRANLKLDPFICDAMMSKMKFGIVCNAGKDGSNISSDTLSSLNAWHNYTINGTEIGMPAFATLVCDTEKKCQQMIASNNSIKAVLASFFTMIIIVFAGGWSDKKKLRKPLMLFAMIGEFLGSIPSLLSATYFDEIPMQFAHTLSYVLPAMFGGLGMMMMGCYAYLTCITTKENRTARFGIFAIYVAVLPSIVAPFSGHLLKALGYVYMYILANILFFLGILQIVFFLEEAREPMEKQTIKLNANKIGSDNPAFENTEPETGKKTIGHVVSTLQPPTLEPKVAHLKQKVLLFLSEFFDPTLVMDSLKVLVEKHKNFGRTILYLCLLNGVLMSCVSGEGDYVNKVARLKFGWEGPEFGQLYSLATFSALVGTAVMTNIIPKFFQISDGMIGIVGSVGSIISKFVFGIANIEVMYWIAQGLNLFLTTKGVAIRSILSKTFDDNSLGKVFSLIAILDSFVGFVAPVLYAEFYKAVLNTNPSLVFHLGQLFLVPSAVLFGITYYIFEYKRKKPEEVIRTSPTPDVTTAEC